MEPFRLVIDAARCDGHGICALRCPELVTLDEWGYAAVDGGQVTSVPTWRRARRAVAACPERALNLEKTGPMSSPDDLHPPPVTVTAASDPAPRHKNATGGAESGSWKVATKRRSSSL
ncbi:MAG TPA: ferredoxin [Acidimicrobiales bacterium]|nr:ferredoxin [Acidimicrobiales bacterium]